MISDQVFIKHIKKTSPNIHSLVIRLKSKFPSFKPKYICDMYQTHSTNLKIVGNINSNISYKNTDGLITTNKSVALVIKSADCIPLVISDIKGSFVAAIHLGWKGLADNFLKEIFDTIKSLDFNQSLTAHIGPSIRKCCYSHTQKPKQSSDRSWKPFIKKHDGKWFVDLQGYLIKNLTDNGISPENIFDEQICTFHNQEYYSYKKHKKFHKSSLGSMLTVVQLKS